MNPDELLVQVQKRLSELFRLMNGDHAPDKPRRWRNAMNLCIAAEETALAAGISRTALHKALSAAVARERLNWENDRIQTSRHEEIMTNAS